jgi:hypothetical protein
VRSALIRTSGLADFDDKGSIQSATPSTMNSPALLPIADLVDRAGVAP